MKVYRFDELADDVKRKVLEAHRFVLVEDYCWCSHIYDLAKAVGFEIVVFDLEHRCFEAKLKIDMLASIERVLEIFSVGSSPYNVAKSYHDKIMGLADNGCDDYVKDMGEEFLKMLELEFDSLTSDESIIDYFYINNYEFII